MAAPTIIILGALITIGRLIPIPGNSDLDKAIDVTITTNLLPGALQLQRATSNNPRNKQ